MTLSKLVRVAALSLSLSVIGMAAFADPPAPQACSCQYCSHTSNTKPCTNFDGSTVTCGYFLAVTLCQG